KVLDKENLKMIKETLANLERVTGTLAFNSKKLDIILENTSNASKQFIPLLQNSAGAMKVFEIETLPATYRLISNLDDMTRTLSEVAQEIKQNPSVLLRGT